MKDKTSRVFELISAIILGLYCIVMIVYAQLHPINTKVNGMHSYTFPVALYAIMLACRVLLIVQNRITAPKQKKRPMRLCTPSGRERLGEERKAEFHYHRTDRRVWITAALIVVYAALWKVVGFMIATAAVHHHGIQGPQEGRPLWQCSLVALGRGRCDLSDLRPSVFDLPA